MAPGFEPTTFETLVSSKTTRPGLLPQEIHFWTDFYVFLNFYTTDIMGCFEYPRSAVQIDLNLYFT